MARAREVAARRPPLVRPPLGIAHGIPGDPANRSAKLSGWLAAVHVFRRATHSGQLVKRASTGPSSVFEKVLSTRQVGNPKAFAGGFPRQG